MMYHVMIIEDDPMVASINRQYVEATPSFQTDRVFKSGAEALEYLKDHTTDLIILDYYTPLMNGDVFIDRLHAMGKTPAIIMVTSANDTDIVRSLLSRGVLDYLVKPFEYARFRTALERFAAQQEYLQGARPSLSQNAIDQLFAGPDPAADSVPQLSKGLNEATLNMIRRFLAEHPEDLFTSEQIAEQIHLSRITIRRYMNWISERSSAPLTIRPEAGRPFSTAWAAGIIRFKAGGTTKLTKVCYILTKIDFSSTAIYTFFINCLCL